jgi:hypothetical protein
MGSTRGTSESTRGTSESTRGTSESTKGTQEGGIESARGTPEGTATGQMVTGTLPVLFNGTVYTHRLAAHLASLFDQLDVTYIYRRHRLLVDNQDHPIVPDFWLPATNTFLFVYPNWPNYDQCLEHEAIAKLGHNVTVFVGSRLTTAIPPKAVGDYLHGWTVETITGELRQGWTAFMWMDGATAESARPGVQISNMVFPADKRAIHPSLIRCLETARKAVDDYVPQEGPRGLCASPDGLCDSTDSELSRTLGKSLRFK